jgi:hypothetical protein
MLALNEVRLKLSAAVKVTLTTHCTSGIRTVKRGELSSRAMLRQNPAAVFDRDDKAFCDVAFARAFQQSIDRVLPHRLIGLRRYTIIGDDAGR